MKNIIIIILLCLITSCASTRKVTEVPVVVEQEHTEYVSSDTKDSTLVRDSIYVHDSIYVKEKGDTLYYYKYTTEYKDKIQYKYITKTDTLCIRDSIPYPVTVTEYKEVVTNKLTWLQQTLVYLGVLSLIVLLVTLGIKYIKLYLKR